MATALTRSHGIAPRALQRVVLAAALCAATTLALPRHAGAWGADDQALADRIASLTGIRAGSTVAEIGAGHGAMTVRMARKVGPAGRVYSTEIDPQELAEIRSRAAAAGLANVTVVQATDTETGLAANCCNVIYMIGVYHHFTDPAAYDRSIYRALRPAGTLLVSDFYPTWLFALWTTADMRRNFGGHGVAEPQLVEQLTTAGFQVAVEIPDYPPSWLLRNYCVVFRKPASPKAEGPASSEAAGN
jgi:SAM-dependent methyltransferase